MNNIIGVDPGLGGSEFTLFTVGYNFSGPAVSWKNKTIEPRRMHCLYPAIVGEKSFVFIEKLVPFCHGNAKISPVAIAKMYGSYRYLLATYQSHFGQDNVIQVIPQRWQRKVCGRLPRLEYKERKKWLYDFATDLAKKKKISVRITFSNCDAFLIAYYGYLTILGG